MASHENFIATRLPAISMEKTIWPSYEAFQNFKLIQLVKALEIAAYSVYNMGIRTGVSYLDNMSSLHNIIFSKVSVLYNQYTHTHFF